MSGNGQISPINQVQYAPVGLVGLSQSNAPTFVQQINKLNGNIDDKSGMQIHLLFSPNSSY